MLRGLCTKRAGHPRELAVYYYVYHLAAGTSHARFTKKRGAGKGRYGPGRAAAVGCSPACPSLFSPAMRHRELSLHCRATIFVSVGTTTKRIGREPCNWAERGSNSTPRANPGRRQLGAGQPGPANMQPLPPGKARFCTAFRDRPCSGRLHGGG